MITLKLFVLGLSKINDLQVFALGACCGVMAMLALLAWLLWIEFKKSTHWKD